MFKVGDIVICIDDKHTLSTLKVGKLYRIINVEINLKYKKIILDLVDIKNNRMCRGWFSDRFRKYGQTNPNNSIIIKE